MALVFEELAALRRALAFLMIGARTDRGIAARTLDRKTQSAATQGTVAVSLNAIGIMPRDFRDYLLATFLQMGAVQPGGGFAWDVYEHSSVWATARALQGFLTVGPEKLRQNTDVSQKLLSAFDWLENQRNADGGFGFQNGLESRVLYSAFVGQALLAGIAAAADEPTLGDAVARFKERLEKLLRYFSDARLGGQCLWPDGLSKTVCPMSTLFALQLIRQSGIIATSVITLKPADLVRAASLIRKPLLSSGAFYRFRDESSVNWRFEEFIPGRLRLLGELFEVTDEVIQVNLAYLANNIVVRENYCGWGYPDTTEPVTWITALGLDSISWASESYSNFSKNTNSPKPLAGSVSMSASNKVFVVHGHDDGARESVARVLEKWGLEPIILHEQVDGGKTVIEKFEAHADVGFAVVLLTPDDEGGKRGGAVHARARQNVVLELGYFMAKLGRSRVLALKRGEVELPTDFSGVIYVNFDDAGAWRHRLGRELSSAGYKIDLNRG